MSYLFKDFVAFSNMKRYEYIDNLKKQAKKLPLSSIINHLDLDEIAIEIAREKNHKFEEGTPLSFSVHPAYFHFDVSVYPDKTRLKRDCSEIREYTGRSAVNFYTTLSKKINEVIEEYKNDVPF